MGSHIDLAAERVNHPSVLTDDEAAPAETLDTEQNRDPPPLSESRGKSSVCSSSNCLCRFTESGLIPTTLALSSVNSDFKSRKLQLCLVQL